MGRTRLSRPHGPHLSPLSWGTEALRPSPLGRSQETGKGRGGRAGPRHPIRGLHAVRPALYLPLPGSLCPLLRPSHAAVPTLSSMAPDLGCRAGPSGLSDAGALHVHSRARSPPRPTRPRTAGAAPAEPPWGEEPSAMLALLSPRGAPSEPWLPTCRPSPAGRALSPWAAPVSPDSPLPAAHCGSTAGLGGGGAVQPPARPQTSERRRPQTSERRPVLLRPAALPARGPLLLIGLS